ncbi:MAG: hypothetical protein RR140_01620 [Clostridia bacterium]
MSKKSSRVKFIIISIFVAIATFFTVFQFNVPFTNKTWNGFARSVELGLDLGGGVYALYDAKMDSADPKTLETGIDETLESLNAFWLDRKQIEPIISKIGTSQIKVEVLDFGFPTNMFEWLGNPKQVHIKKTNDSKAEDVLSTQHISTADISADQNKYGVIVKLNANGAKIFEKLVEEIGSDDAKLYCFLDDETSSTLTIAVKKQMTGAAFFMASSTDMTSSLAQELAYNIVSGTFTAKLSHISDGKVNALYGENAMLLFIIAFSVILFATMLYLFLSYGDFGLLGSFSLFIWVILTIFFLQAVPVVQLTASGLAGILLSFAITAFINIFIFEKIRKEYEYGKKLPLACKAGFKNAIPTIADFGGISLIASLIFWIATTGGAKSFGVSLFIGTAVMLFTTLIITRWFIKLYLPLNSTNAGKLKFKKEASDEKAV